MLQLFQRFIQLEAASSTILLLTAVLAMLIANSPYADSYQLVTASAAFWINDGLMAIFFLLVGLELKRGMIVEQAGQFSNIILPAVAAVGGMIVPALIYLAINYQDPISVKGWPIPVATDIAFAVGILSIFGSRVPAGLKLFLLSLAIFDDVGAIIIIAAVFNQSLLGSYVALSMVALLALLIMNQFRVLSLWPYMIIGLVLWVGLLFAGIHPTLAGVLLAFTIPVSNKTRSSPLHRLEGYLHPWVAYFIMPLFAFANAGVSLQGLNLPILKSGVVLGIILGLVVGKQIGVFLATWLLVRLRWAILPVNTSWSMVYGASILCGIGFTMSLFLGTLSFAADPFYLTEVRLGVILASVISGVLGALVLIIAFNRK